MKNKIYAISLILSFLVVLGHEMIFHHHHDPIAEVLFDCHSPNDPTCEKNEESGSTEEHNHQFPLHHHILATNGFISAKTNIQESSPANKISLLFGVSNIFQPDFFEPPCLTILRFKDKPFLISSNYYPAAVALRGPPAIV